MYMEKSNTHTHGDYQNFTGLKQTVNVADLRGSITRSCGATSKHLQLAANNNKIDLYNTLFNHTQSLHYVNSTS